MSDRQLLDDYVRGDVRAFERLVRRHEGPLLRYATHLLRDPDAAQDAVQESFLRLIREARRLRRVQDVSAWLFRVCRNVSLDFVKKEARMRRRHVKAACDSAGCPPDRVEAGEVRAIVARELAHLPANQQEVLILRIQQDKSYREIGEITGLSTGNVGYLIHHGLKTLAHRLRVAGVI